MTTLTPAEETALIEYDRSFERLLLTPAEPDGSFNAAIRSAFIAGRRSKTGLTLPEPVNRL